MKSLFLNCITVLFFLLVVQMQVQAQNTGIFEGATDVGPVKHKGTSAHAKSTGDYVLAGSGANIWGGKDEFHFLWRKLTGDFILQTRANF
jgi:hypothetical protein